MIVLDLMFGYLELYVILPALLIPHCSIKFLGMAVPSEVLSNPDFSLAQIRQQMWLWLEKRELWRTALYTLAVPSIQETRGTECVWRMGSVDLQQ